jgi:hypothetical protein
MVDLRKELGDIIRDYGSDYLLIKAKKTIPCKCVVGNHGTARDDCPVCLGTGYLVKAVRVRGRSAIAAIPETLPRMMSNAEPGQVAVPSKQFYLNYKSRPYRKDLIVVCEWDGNVPIIDEYSEIFEVNEVDPNRGDNGRIEYFIASAKGDPINSKVRLANIISNSKKEFYVSVGDEE